MAPCRCTMQIPCVLHSVCGTKWSAGGSVSGGRDATCTLWLVSVGILPRSGGAATRLVDRGGGPVMCLTRPLSSRGSLSSPGPFAWSFTERVVARTFLWVPWSVVVPTAACECSVNSLPIQCARASSLLLSLPGVSARKDPHSPCSVQPKCLLFQHYTTLEMFIVPATHHCVLANTLRIAGARAGERENTQWRP